MPRLVGSGGEREMIGQFKASPYWSYGFVRQCCIFM